ncbi:hypothetical protein KC19_2G149400 [Ceratodon purpureus]|uniref:Uncharacterized protein n=1 Tax=Ceratodon purpureus TaxID=3225 RepID=A0A8T0IX21_CERPU|nr:hypothetical protein KC19_2G149400 [Ceratodon purpureus]
MSKLITDSPHIPHSPHSPNSSHSSHILQHTLPSKLTSLNPTSRFLHHSTKAPAPLSHLISSPAQNKHHCVLIPSLTPCPSLHWHLSHLHPHEAGDLHDVTRWAGDVSHHERAPARRAQNDELHMSIFVTPRLPPSSSPSTSSRLSSLRCNCHRLPGFSATNIYTIITYNSLISSLFLIFQTRWTLASEKLGRFRGFGMFISGRK